MRRCAATPPRHCYHTPLCYVILLLCVQVGFYDEKVRRYTKVPRKSNDILNRLEKTRRELTPDFKTEKEVRRGTAGG